MTSGQEKLAKDFENLKATVAKLQEEVQFLKENYKALGFLPEDSIVSEKELTELERIDRLVDSGNLDEFEELK